MKARIVRIGNSRGVRLPKPLIEQAGLTEEIELVAEDGRIVISSASRIRAGWAEAVRLLHDRGEDGLLDAGTSTRFNQGEWEWR